MKLIEQIKVKAARLNKTIVLPEGEEPRTLKAAEIVLREGISQLILLGDEKTIQNLASELEVNIEKATIVNPKTDFRRDAYANMMVEIRKSKGLTKDDALKLLDDPLFFGPIMIKAGDADGEIAGAINATGDVLRPAFQFVKTLPGCSVVSGAFLMFVKEEFGHNGVMVFSDCAVMPDPNENQLAEIAVTTARTAKAIVGMEPKVALLSFSTKGSAKHPMADKVVNATLIAQELAPDLIIDGEMQLDAAIIKEVGELKAPGSKVAGQANVLVFPSLESGNIGYKLVQRFAGAEAIGPILQGMAAPINDLSRGCSVNDIVNMIAVTAAQAGGE
ncbi:MAG: phosphate acetyltransferase [Prolixibacteraceae bacterium]|jgi:phosphate acetyltransferase|nr:phosphate acetyltransferase [Prolixibacteraceae bacterium]